MLASPEDYKWLKTELDQDDSSVVHYKEYDLGHLAFILPHDTFYFSDLLPLLFNHSADFRSSNENKNDILQ